MFSMFADLLRCITVSAGLAALTITFVAVNIWTRPKGEDTDRGNTHGKCSLQKLKL